MGVGEGVGRKSAAAHSRPPPGAHLSQAATHQKRSFALVKYLKMSALFFSEIIFASYILIILSFGRHLNTVKKLYSVILALAVLTDSRF